MEEKNKEWTSKYNPYNSDKLFSQINRWKGIKDWLKDKGNLPAPTTISIDPANICDLKCLGCNAEFLMQRNHNLLSKDTLKEIADFLPTWGDSPYRVEGACIGGGGESLLNPYTGEFIQQLKKNGIKSGVVTNGTHIDKHLEALCDCEWVGVSVDAGNVTSYNHVKGANKFYQVLHNIEKLIQTSQAPLMNGRNLTQDGCSTLNLPGRGHGVSYKYLLRPETIDEVYRAAKIAKSIGCKSMHIRPIAPPWDKVKDITDIFNKDDLDRFRYQIEKARELEDKDFNIYGITHKFDGNFNFANNFNKCNAVYMTAIIMPPTDKYKGKFDLGLCCDRRGDNLLTKRNLTSVEQIRNYWGSKEHKELIDKIDVKNCPRCTFSPHNKIYENVIEVNNMTPDFI